MIPGSQKSTSAGHEFIQIASNNLAQRRTTKSFIDLLIWIWLDFRGQLKRTEQKCCYEQKTMGCEINDQKCYWASYQNR
jgi:hypothetical protein